jgi:hypothetical protein
VNDILPNHPDQPPRELRGDLWAQGRYSELVGVLGAPQDRAEHHLLLTLATLFGRDDVRHLLMMVRRAVRAKSGDYGTRHNSIVQIAARMSA